MKTIIFASTILLSAPCLAQSVSDAPMPEAPAVEMAQEQNKSEFLAPAATEQDMKEIEKAERAARAQDRQLQRAAAAKLKKPKRAPASVSEPKFEKKKKAKSKNKKKKKKSAM